MAHLAANHAAIRRRRVWLRACRRKLEVLAARPICLSNAGIRRRRVSAVAWLPWNRLLHHLGGVSSPIREPIVSIPANTSPRSMFDRITADTTVAHAAYVAVRSFADLLISYSVPLAGVGAVAMAL